MGNQCKLLDIYIYIYLLRYLWIEFILWKLFGCVWSSKVTFNLFQSFQMPEKTICLFELFLIHSHNNNDNDLSLFSQSTSVCALSVFKDNTPPKKKKKKWYSEIYYYKKLWNMLVPMNKKRVDSSDSVAIMISFVVHDIFVIETPLIPPLATIYRKKQWI